MRYVKSLLILNILLYTSISCYGATLTDKIILDNPASVSTKVNSTLSLNPSKERHDGSKKITERSSIGLKPIPQRGFTYDPFEQMKKESEYLEQQVKNQSE